MPEMISGKIGEVEERIKNSCSGCDDIILRRMRLGTGEQVECLVVYVEAAVSNMMLEDSVIGKLLNHLWELDAEKIRQAVLENGLGISDVKELETMEEAMAALMAGNAIFFLEGYTRALKISSKGYPGMGVVKAESEKVLRGSREAFSEALKINTALIRKRIRTSELKVEEMFLGRRSQTLLALVYLEELAYPGLLDEVRERLQAFEIDGIMDSGMIEQLTSDVWYSPFPQFQTTERPDRAAAAVLDGRVVLLCDNSPVALLLPTTLNSLVQTGDDYYGHFEIASLLRCIRYLAVFLAFSLPGLYLAVTGFHPQILPTNLVLSMAEARRGVPFPGMVEVLLIEVSFELMREAGLRMPGPIGNMIGIVGGLIIGQSAVAANLISPVIVIVEALTAL
ncbi:MAG: spore germination protein, partial [Lachnospiraceae bacterium]|nr:spore germination protein [Lachnospiraceae bacterium]